MDKAMWDKLAAAGGIVAVVLIVVGILVVGQPPEISDDAASVADFFQDNRDQVLWGTFLQGLGVLAIIWFIAALGVAMRNAGEGRLAAAMGIAFAITFSVGAVAALLRAALAYSVADEAADPSVVLALYHSAAAMDTLSSLIGAGIYAAVAGAVIRTGLLHTWWGWLSGVAALWSVVSATAWGRDGFWSPDGAGFISFIVFLAWVLVTSILLTMKGRTSTSVSMA
ncbi:hypothetical protein BH20ACT14_BH20ACT14_15910 [soil metagenome]